MVAARDRQRQALVGRLKTGENTLLAISVLFVRLQFQKQLLDLFAPGVGVSRRFANDLESALL